MQRRPLPGNLLVTEYPYTDRGSQKMRQVYRLIFLGCTVLNMNNLTMAESAYSLPKSQITSSVKLFFVSPDGDDKNNGHTSHHPLKTINLALQKAQAGDTVFLLPGTYIQDIATVRNGNAMHPIRITGNHEAIVHGAGKSHMIDINHSYIELSNFTVDGKIGAGNKLEDYRDKLVYIKGKKDLGVGNVSILGMKLQNAYGECVRIKYMATNNEIANNKIQNCGLRDYVYNRGKHNGEAIYIGTAPEQISEGVNPTKEIDQSNGNWIHHNYISPHGSECIDIKEGSSKNIIEYNTCTNQKDDNVGGISVRGNDNTIRYNIIFSNKGAGIRLGGDTKSDGINNTVYGNFIYDNAAGGLKIIRSPQKKVCGNTVITRPGQKKVRTKGIPASEFLKACGD